MKMKILFLNTWDGKMKYPISDFIREQLHDTDIFCFQEVYPKMRKLCQEILSDFQEFYAYKKISDDDFAQATYVRKNINVEFFTVLDKSMNVGLGIDAKIKTIKGNLHVCNFHGRCRPGDKLDDPLRLKQSKELIDFYRDKVGARIIGGDFNMLPNTESVRMFSGNGYRDLIWEFNIKTTRNPLAWESYPNDPQKHADYVFLDKNISLKKFEVIENEVSDHLPLVLEVNL